MKKWQQSWKAKRAPKWAPKELTFVAICWGKLQIARLIHVLLHAKNLVNAAIWEVTAAERFKSVLEQLAKQFESRHRHQIAG